MLRLLFCVPQLDILYKQLYGAVKSEFGGIHRNIIATGIAPLVFAVGVVEVLAALVSLLHADFRLILRNSLALCGALYLRLSITENEHAYQRGILAEYVIRASSDNNKALAGVRLLLDVIKLHLSDDLLGGVAEAVHSA